MGDRKCAVQGCNALEFRDTGICNKHRGEGIEPLGADAEKVVGAAAGVGLGLVDIAIGNLMEAMAVEILQKFLGSGYMNLTSLLQLKMVFISRSYLILLERQLI